MPAPQLLGPLTVSSFSTALVSCFDNPVLYVLFQSGRSGARFLLVSFIRCSCPLEASFCIYFQHEDHVGDQLKNAQPLQDISGHAQSGVVRVPESSGSTSQLYWSLAREPCESHSISWGLSVLNCFVGLDKLSKQY